jgi:hypothetical protein
MKGIIQLHWNSKSNSNLHKCKSPFKFKLFNVLFSLFVYLTFVHPIQRVLGEEPEYFHPNREKSTTQFSTSSNDIKYSINYSFVLRIVLSNAGKYVEFNTRIWRKCVLKIDL